MSNETSRPSLREAEDVRVYVVLKVNFEEVYLIGMGNYKGESEAPYGPFNMTPEEWKKTCVDNGANADKFKPFKDSEIYLENGRVVWGKEVLWGLESNFDSFVGNRTVLMVDDFRSKYDPIHALRSIKVA